MKNLKLLVFITSIILFNSCSEDDSQNDSFRIDYISDIIIKDFITDNLPEEDALITMEDIYVSFVNCDYNDIEEIIFYVDGVPYDHQSYSFSWDDNYFRFLRQLPVKRGSNPMIRVTMFVENTPFSTQNIVNVPN